MNVNPEVTKAVGEIGLWIISAIIIGVILIQSVLYMRLSFKTAKLISFPEAKCKEAIKVGMVSAIGPSIAVFVVMVAMISRIGVPLAWMRLATIGAAPTEMAAATVGAATVGKVFDNTIDLRTLSVSIWTMTINSAGWLLITLLLAHKMEDVRTKIGGGDPKWLGILSMGAAIGAFGFFNVNAAMGAVRAMQAGAAGASGGLWAIIGGFLAMVGFIKLSQKLTWLREYTLGLAMIVGMVLAMALR